MAEDNQRRFYRGSARWIIIGIVAAVAVIFVVVVAFGSTLFPNAPRTEMQSETADESATSGPGHNTTMGAGDDPLESQEGAVASTPPGAEQIPDADVTFGRETSTLDTPTAGQQQGVNNSTGNGTNGGGSGLENPLSENITSLTGT